MTMSDIEGLLDELAPDQPANEFRNEEVDAESLIPPGGAYTTVLPSEMVPLAAPEA
jgi:hypothetical protein